MGKVLPLLILTIGPALMLLGFFTFEWANSCATDVSTVTCYGSQSVPIDANSEAWPGFVPLKVYQIPQLRLMATVLLLAGVSLTTVGGGLLAKRATGQKLQLPAQ